MPTDPTEYAERIAARLRYRVISQAVQWTYELYRVEHAIDHAFAEALAKVAAETALPVYRGAPEA